MSIYHSVVPRGIKGVEIAVEVVPGRDHGNRPYIDISGSPSRVMSESRKRLLYAFQSQSIELNKVKYEINLLPAAVLKQGTSIDLAIAAHLIVTNYHLELQRVNDALDGSGEEGDRDDVSDEEREDLSKRKGEIEHALRSLKKFFGKKNKTYFLGELRFSGKVDSVPGLLPLVKSCSQYRECPVNVVEQA